MIGLSMSMLVNECGQRVAKLTMYLQAPLEGHGRHLCWKRQHPLGSPREAPLLPIPLFQKHFLEEDWEEGQRVRST